METIYCKDCDTYELYIKQSPDYMYFIYMFCITDNKKYILTKIASRSKAIKIVDRFPEMYNLALQEGYFFDGNNLIHPKGAEASMSFIYNLDISPSYFSNLLWRQII